MQYFGYLPDRGLPAAFVCLFREHLNSSICHCLAFSSATQQREDSTRPHTTNFPIETVAIRHSTPPNWSIPRQPDNVKANMAINDNLSGNGFPEPNHPSWV